MSMTKSLFIAALISVSNVYAVEDNKIDGNAPLALETATRSGAKLLSLDFQSQGDVAAMTFRVVLPSDAKSIDTSRCLSELPKGFTGVCKVYDKVVAVTVYNSEGKVFPAGLNSVGKLSFHSLAKAGASIDTFEASTADGSPAKIGAAKVESLD
jgi:hypothetical protein